MQLGEGGCRTGSAKITMEHHDTSKERLDSLARAKWAELGGSAEGLKPAERLRIPSQPMPSQPADVRCKNMSEVALGYTETMARLEAARCLQCPTQPCVSGCPVELPIRDFVKAIARGDFGGAIGMIKEKSLLPSVCGRVCPQEVQCQSLCTVGKALKDVGKAVAIGRLERFVADLERSSGKVEVPSVAASTGKRVAIVGSGPASLTCASDVRRAGHDVTVFEAFHKFGGVMVYGIPEFRLPKAIVESEVDTLRRMGVKFRSNMLIGRSYTVHSLLETEGYSAVFLGTGAGLPHFMGIEGENLVGVFSANEYLTRANLMRAYERGRAATLIVEARRVAVLGGGNVAMDAARTALRLGAEEVYLVYRRTEVEMPARREEVEHAREEGVQFHLLRNAKRVLGNERGQVVGLECLKYELGEPDASGRRSPVPIQGSEYVLDVDAVIVAIGNGSNPLLQQTTPGLEFNKRGNIIADERGATSIPGVFAGGDIVLGAATVILAMGQGRRAAAAINEYLAEL